MHRVASHLTLLALAFSFGCQEECEDRCRRDFDDCVKRAQSPDDKAACQQTANTCFVKCPKGQQPQYDYAPDE